MLRGEARVPGLVEAASGRPGGREGTSEEASEAEARRTRGASLGRWEEEPSAGQQDARRLQAAQGGVRMTLTPSAARHMHGQAPEPPEPLSWSESPGQGGVVVLHISNISLHGNPLTVERFEHVGR